jgi:hypothetical protein
MRNAAEKGRNPLFYQKKAIPGWKNTTFKFKFYSGEKQMRFR